MIFCVSNPVAGIYKLDPCEDRRDAASIVHVLPRMEVCVTHDGKIVAFDSLRKFKVFSQDAMECPAEYVFWLEKDVWRVEFKRCHVFFQFPHGVACSFPRQPDQLVASSISTVQRCWRRRTIRMHLDARIFSRARVSRDILASRFGVIAGRADVDLDDLVFNHILFIR